VARWRLLAALPVLALVLGAGYGLWVWRAQPPERPSLLADPGRLERLRAREEAILGSYGWVDREAGIARIPIEDAMAVLAERGWPDGE
jgi:hypothetical protein